MTNKGGQQGSVLFYILIGVVLFAALGYAVSNMMRGAPSEIGSEKARLYADEILGYAHNIRGAVKGVMISNQCSDTDISFENAGVSGYTNGTDTACQVFHADGGGAAWVTPVSEVNGGTDWIYSGSNTVPEAGADATADLVMILPGIAQTLCLSLNEKLGIAAVSGDAPADSDDFDTTKFTGSYTASAQIGEAAHFKSQPAGCFKNTTPTPDTYNFYQVLIAR